MKGIASGLTFVPPVGRAGMVGRADQSCGKCRMAAATVAAIDDDEGTGRWLAKPPRMAGADESRRVAADGQVIKVAEPRETVCRSAVTPEVKAILAGRPCLAL